MADGKKAPFFASDIRFGMALRVQFSERGPDSSPRKWFKSSYKREEPHKNRRMALRVQGEEPKGSLLHYVSSERGRKGEECLCKRLPLYILYILHLYLFEDVL